ncbi:hypothetical protein ACROYT_G014939 [Oculina patagonica]
MFWQRNWEDHMFSSALTHTMLNTGLCFCNGTHASFVSKEGQNTVTDLSGGEHLLKPAIWNKGKQPQHQNNVS